MLFKKGATEEPAALPGGVIPGHGTWGRSHLAFSIPAEDVGPWQERLAGAGIAVESTASWPGGARSLDFRDPDPPDQELLAGDRALVGTA